MTRGQIHECSSLGGPRLFLVVSADEVAQIGNVIVVEVTRERPPGPRGLLSVGLRPDDPAPGAVVRTDRINYMSVTRLGPPIGRLTASTMSLVDMALRAALDLH